MGLDMYLTKRTYVKNWDHMTEDQKHTIAVHGPEAKHIQTDRIKNIEEEVAYWRKANHIHKWFVDNVQDGKDDCGSYYVSRDQLQELVVICKKVIRASVMVDAAVMNGSRIGPDTGGEWEPILEEGQQVENFEDAKALLPTASGFFFGNTDYDQYYIQDCQDTIDMLDPVLKEPEGVSDFYYQSSW